MDFHDIWELDVDFLLVRLADADYPCVGLLRCVLLAPVLFVLPFLFLFLLLLWLQWLSEAGIAIVFACIIDYLFE